MVDSQVRYDRGPAGDLYVDVVPVKKVRTGLANERTDLVDMMKKKKRVEWKTLQPHNDPGGLSNLNTVAGYPLAHAALGDGRRCGTKTDA